MNITLYGILTIYKNNMYYNMYFSILYVLWYIEILFVSANPYGHMCVLLIRTNLFLHLINYSLNIQN
jgi:hypothetical protein